MEAWQIALDGGPRPPKTKTLRYRILQAAARIPADTHGHSLWINNRS
jgi:hypothetical protein